MKTEKKIEEIKHEIEILKIKYFNLSGMCYVETIRNDLNKLMELVKWNYIIQKRKKRNFIAIL